jgi:hypothetical protein
VPSQPVDGSAPAQLRNAFIDLIEQETRGDEACRLAGQLLDCTDLLPGEYCEMLGVAAGSTFAEAARTVHDKLGCVGPS